MGITASTAKSSNEKMTKIELKHGSGKSSATVMLFGATITSWIVDGKEKIFVSKKAIMDGSKAIRGGVPVCFPNFGPWSNGRPQHGFARNSKDWTIKDDAQVDPDTGDVQLALELKDTEESRKMWDGNKFCFTYTIVLKEKSLELGVKVDNQGDQDLDLTFCFHTYFTTSDLSLVAVQSLKGLTYTDKTVEGWPQVQEANEVLKIQGFTDRVYAHAPNEIQVQTGKDEKLKLVKSGMEDWVVWNPAETASKMADMHENGNLEFVCVEATQTSDRIKVEAGKSWCAGHSMFVL